LVFLGSESKYSFKNNELQGFLRRQETCFIMRVG
jgi:hypothetical protein